MPTPHHPSSAVQRALRALGADLRDARKRRELPMQIVAERAFTEVARFVRTGEPFL
ncbi:hypothetical protein [Aquidulcibacter sp.]|jgi:hypothetical protein|uniref:hypothetical protein n=1 Tax=Aquidulcibacter sp. TaxID=2052990 RepID=UPI0037BF7635